jgi:hypothetical protein
MSKKFNESLLSDKDRENWLRGFPIKRNKPLILFVKRKITGRCLASFKKGSCWHYSGKAHWIEPILFYAVVDNMGNRLYTGVIYSPLCARPNRDRDVIDLYVSRAPDNDNTIKCKYCLSKLERV